MQRVKMLKTELGSIDGLTVQTFMAGRAYDVPDALVLAFIDMGVCELEHGEAPPLETKAPRKKRGRK